MIKNIIERLKDVASPYRKYDGLSPDNRPASEKSKDWLAIEIYGPTTPLFRTVQENQWNKYQVRNQGNSGSCVANTVAKILEVKRFLEREDSIKFSHAPIYMHRVNKPTGGMVGIDALQLAVKYSSCREEDLPSEYLTDSQLDSLSLPLDYEKKNNWVAPTNYLVCPTDFDYVASMVNKEGAVMVWVDTSYSNWNRDIPLPGGRGGGVRHSVTAVDAITLDGKQYLVIEDSWGKFGKYNGQRLISRETFNTNFFFAAVLTNFKFDVVEADPDIFKEFTTVLVYGDKGKEVYELQRFLATQGVFPSNYLVRDPNDAYYGNITAEAVYLFQVKNNVDSLTILKQLKGRKSRVGAKTLAIINKILKK
jgi:hypothetical protein